MKKYVFDHLKTEGAVSVDSCVSFLSPYFAQTSAGVRKLIHTWHNMPLGRSTVVTRGGIEYILEKSDVV